MSRLLHEVEFLLMNFFRKNQHNGRDWKQESVFYALKSSSSLADCTHCSIPNRIPLDSCNIPASYACERQTQGPEDSPRNVLRTVGSQLKLTLHSRSNMNVPNLARIRKTVSSESAIEFPLLLLLFMG